jgi:hypothetical protein
MKTCSGPESRNDGSRQKARGFLATNLAMPGAGSLAAGRKIGLVQLALCLTGFTLTTVSGLQFVYWSLANWSKYHGPNVEMDPLKPLIDLWQHARWPLLGVALFAISWLWALLTSRSLLAESKRHGDAS